MTRAGFWVRAAALAIDAGACWLFAWGVTYVILLLPLSWEDPAPWLANLPDTLFWALLLAYGATEALWPATPGKRLLGLAIANPDGSPAERGRLFFRWSTKYYSILVSLIWAITLHPGAYVLGGFMNIVLGVGFLYASTDDKRAWHDEWAGTAVYRRRRVPPPLPYGGYQAPPRGGTFTASA